MAKPSTHKWEFRARFRRHAFGWKSQPAIKRIKEAVSEIKKVARKDKLLAAEGAVLFLEKVSPALEHVDSSSGAVAKKYPHKKPAEILEDLVAHTPGEEGKWFAAAKDAKLFDEAIALANRTPCSPQTLTRAARDFEEKRPEFAIEAGMAALRWLLGRQLGLS
jgi:hypothetical protein